MNRIEYIRYSHRRANSRVRAWIGSVRMRLVRRSRLLGWIWMVPASIFYALVVLFSWLTFCVVLFRDPRFTLHYLESEIECRGLSGAEARRYLDEQHRDYERRLAYGNFTRDEQRRIDQTFAYLYNRYPAPVRDDLNTRLDEVQSAVAEIAGFTRQRQEELEQARERETALQAQAEKRRAINRSRTGFDPTPEDFSPRLTDRLQTFFDGNLWIITRRKKTNTESNIRLLDVPKRIIEKYKGLARDGHVFPVPSNGSCNKILKEIGRQCGFKVRLTYHVARHTNATTVLLSHGVPIETVSRLLGHTNIKTTQIYAKITAQKISRDMEALSHKLEDMEKNICRAI